MPKSQTFYLYMNGEWQPRTPDTVDGCNALAALVFPHMTVDFVRRYVYPSLIERDGPVFMLEGYDYSSEGGSLGMKIPAFPGFEGAAAHG